MLWDEKQEAVICRLTKWNLFTTLSRSHRFLSSSCLLIFLLISIVCKLETFESRSRSEPLKELGFSHPDILRGEEISRYEALRMEKIQRCTVGIASSPILSLEKQPCNDRSLSNFLPSRMNQRPEYNLHRTPILAAQLPLRYAPAPCPKRSLPAAGSV